MLNKNNLIKYLILFIIVSVSTYCIPNCCIINQHAIYIGLIAGTTFILLDEASIELSKSSLIIEEGLSIISPAAILVDNSLFNICIGMFF